MNDRIICNSAIFLQLLKALKTKDFQRTIAEIAENVNFLFILIVIYEKEQSHYYI